MGRSEAMACVFAGNQDFAIRRGLKPKIKNAKVKIGRCADSISVTQAHHRRGSGGGQGAKLPAAVQFFVIFCKKKTSYFNAIGS